VDAIVPPSVYEDIQRYAADWTSTPVVDFMDFMTTQLQTLAFTSENQRSESFIFFFFLFILFVMTFFFCADSHTDTSTAVAVKLLCGVLSGARIVEHCGNEKIRLAYVKRLDNLSQVLKQMGAVAKSSQVSIAYLNLATKIINISVSQIARLKIIEED